ncbi:ATPase ARSA1 [Selaginella moellendorffii]|nr:ATPase ARSA1 [Selaginella moellendorffii]|eukprot:XP_002974288.2 ATPase ARSA1 [Selaginella moellendorffii]
MAGTKALRVSRVKKAFIWYTVTFGMYEGEIWEVCLANIVLALAFLPPLYLIHKHAIRLLVSEVIRPWDKVLVLSLGALSVWMLALAMPTRLMPPPPSPPPLQNSCALSSSASASLIFPVRHSVAGLRFGTRFKHAYTSLSFAALVASRASIPRWNRCNRVFAASFQAKAVANPVEVESGFDEMVAGTKRKYFMLGGKGGVGKTSLAASLAVKFANSGHTTLVVSTDPAHSLSDSFAQDLSGGKLVPVEGPDSPLFALEINPEQARSEFRAAAQTGSGTGVKDFMDSFGLGGWVEQISELKLGELLDTPPPGLDEAIAISKVVQFMQSPEYDRFTRIIFDTAPTGHTLRLLSLPDFLDASIGKLLKLKQKLASATNAIKSVFGQGDGSDTATNRLEQLKERMVMVREIFRNKEATEFVIVTIPTVMAVSESSRLKQSLEKEGVPVKRLIVNQVLAASQSDCKFCSMRRKDQSRAFDIINSDQNLKDLQLIQSPLMDVEIRGVPALRFVGDTVWR